MKRLKRVFAVAMGICLAVILVFAGSPGAGEQAEIEKMISSAQSAAEHEAIAQQYERAATDAQASAEEHKKMAESYKKVGGSLVNKLHLDQHCESLAAAYATVQKENEILAKAHREMATKAK